jgi:hypothetical protein
MFPVTHLYVVKSLLAPQSLSNLAILGAIYPDTCISNQFTWRATHGQGLDILRSLSQAEQSDFAPFFTGLFSHGVEPRGLDYYGDLDFDHNGTGYSFLKAAPLKEAVARVCGLEEKYGLWKAHNFIEMGIEVRYSKKFPELNRQLLQVLESAHAEIRSLSRMLARFYQVPEAQLESGFQGFTGFLTPAPWDAAQLAAMFVKQLNYRLGERSIDVSAVAALIEEAAGLTLEDGEAFIEQVVRQIKAELPEWLGRGEQS